MTPLYQFQIKTVSWPGHNFMGFTETDQLVTYNKHESKDFKLNVADMEICKNYKEKDLFFCKHEAETRQLYQQHLNVQPYT